MHKLLFIFLLISNVSFSQIRLDGLRYDDTKFSLGLSTPFCVGAYMYNVVDKWGGFLSVMYLGGPGQDSDNEISQWHELTDEYMVNHRGGSVGLMYRLWRPFHLYGGLGIGWGTKQLVYKDTPPVVLEDVYRTSPGGLKPMFHGGLQLTWWRIALGAGYNTYLRGAEFYLGYVIKYVPNE